MSRSKTWTLNKKIKCLFLGAAFLLWIYHLKEESSSTMTFNTLRPFASKVIEPLADFFVRYEVSPDTVSIASPYLRVFCRD